MALLTSYVQFTVMCVFAPWSLLLFHSCSSLLLAATPDDELIFLLFVNFGIVPVFNNTLTFPTLMLACCMAESSHLQNACCTDRNELYSIQAPTCLLFQYLT